MKLLFWFVLLVINGSYFIYNVTHISETYLPVVILNIFGTAASVIMFVSALFEQDTEVSPRKKTTKKKAKDSFERFEAKLKQTRKEQGEAIEN